MIKDKLAEAVKTGLKNINNGNDQVPLNMRGELEVIVKDREGNVLSYERDHNQVTNLAKMAIIHLLAGEIGVNDSFIYAVNDGGNVRNLSLESGDNARIYQSFIPGNHSESSNVDGQLVSGEQFFYRGENVVGSTSSALSQVQPIESLENFTFNYPTKMLFGTGIEAYNGDTLDAAYSDVNIQRTTIYKLNGYDNSPSPESDFFTSSLDKTNWYSHSAYKCRTLQPATVQPLSASVSSTDVSISGAIKNCLITSTSQTGVYDEGTGTAVASLRGAGYPCFIYAKRSTPKFYDDSEGNTEVHYKTNSALQDNNITPYETELVYTVVMPAQPTSSGSIQEFYPYNGWILKQAGLFCDSRFKIRTKEDSPDYGENAFIEKVNQGAAMSNSVNFYRDSVGGQMLFTRNLSSPILKTRDNEVTFVWHIFITI